MQISVRASLDQFELPHPGGEGRFKISIAAPAMLPPETKAPVLYVVDGDLMFGMAAEIARAMSMGGVLPPFYVVGVGYDADFATFMKLRTADLTPPLSPEAFAKLGGMGAVIGEANGGADALLAFLIDVLKPEIATRYPQTNGAVQVLYGHSLGGLFAAHALIERPDAFDAFVSSSPSLWWDDFAILGRLSALGARLEALAESPRAFVAVGGREQDLPTEAPPALGMTLEEIQARVTASRMVDGAREFAEALAGVGLADLRHVVFAEDDHSTVIPASMVHGMRFALGGSV